jgi:hypothetical protein
LEKVLTTQDLSTGKPTWSLNGRKWLLLLFFITLFIRFYEFNTFRDLNSDKVRQLHGAYNLMAGKGISFSSYDLNTGKQQFLPIIDWPPAYSYMAAGISKVSGLDLYKASLLMDFIFISLLWVSLAWLMNLSGATLIQKAAVFLFLSFSRTPLNFIYSADLIGTVLFLLSCCLNLWFIKGKYKNQILFYSCQFMLIVAMCFLKYSLLPAIASLGVSMISFGIFSKQSKAWKAGLALIVLLLLANVLLSNYSHSLNENSSGLYSIRKSLGDTFYPKNLKLIHPFLLAAFVYFDPFYLRISSVVINTVGLITTAVLIFWITKNLFTKIRAKASGYLDHQVVYTLYAVVAFLCLLSLLYPSDENGTYKWSFVKEFRYYSPAVLLAMVYLFQQFSFEKLRRGHLLSVFIGSATVFALLLTTYYWMINNKAGSFASSSGELVNVASYVRERKGDNVYFLSRSNDNATDAKVTSLAAVYGAKVAVTYYNYFPDSTFMLPFLKDKLVDKEKKLIIYLGENLKVLNEINPANSYRVEHLNDHQHLLLIN